jgi:hypothetical protein
MGATVGSLQYISLAALIELKLAAGRSRDDADIVELIRSNSNQVDAILMHLECVHSNYAARFNSLVAKARDEVER